MATPILGLPQLPQGPAPADISTAFNNLTKLLDMLVQARIQNTVTSLPTTTSGDIGKTWLIAHSGTTGDAVGHEDEIALCVGANLWDYRSPGSQIAMIWDLSLGAMKVWSGTSWTLGSGIGDAPIDGNPYVRKDGGWVGGGGDASGAASSVAGNFASFLDTSGKNFADSGKKWSDITDIEDDLYDAIEALRRSYSDLRYVKTFMSMGGCDSGLVANSTATGTSLVTTTNFQTYTTGTGSAIGLAVNTSKGGQALTLSKGTTATGQSCQFITPLRIIQGGVIEYMANLVIPTLSISTQRFVTGCGLFDRISGAIANACYVDSVDSVNSGNWTLHCVNASTDTTTNLGVAPTAGAVQQIRIVIAADGSVGVYINNVLKNTPSAGQLAMGSNLTAPGVRCTGLVGTTNMLIQLWGQSFRQLWPSGTWA